MDYVTPDEAKQELLDHFSTLHSLKDVEIFRTGKWKGIPFTDADLDAMVDAFGKVGYRPPLKLGHSQEVGAPAFGWIDSVRRVGDRLVADFADMPKAVYDAVKDRRYDAVSAEIFRNLERGGEKFGKALKAVALLGSEIPAVSDLKPLHESFDQEADAFDVSLDELKDEPTDEGDDMNELETKLAAAEKDNETLKAQVEALEAKIAELSHEEPPVEDSPEVTELKDRLAKMEAKDRERTIEASVSACTVPAYHGMLTALYSATHDADVILFGEEEKRPSEVLDALVAKINKDAELLFTAFSTDENGEYGKKDDEDQSAGDIVTKRAKELMAQNKELSFSDASKEVLRADEELAKRYAEE